MTLPQYLSKLVSSSSSSPKILSAIRSFATEATQSLPTKRTSGRHPPSFNCLKPTTIPYQSKVANSVDFVGSVEYPVQLSSLPDGVLCAFTVLLQENKRKNLAHLRIPVVFHGDLAETAILHLKEKDLVYVTGQLSAEALLHMTNDKFKHIKEFQTNIQVLASSVMFVQKHSIKTPSKIVVDQDEELDSSAKIDEKPLDHQLWDDLFAHPDDWWDNRSNKGNSKHSMFKHKKSGQSLWINDSTPEWVLSKLDELPSAKTPSIGVYKSNDKVGVYKSNDNDGLWADLIDNPDQWSDYRGVKLKWISPKYPDFKQKSTGTALWLSSAPDWAIPKLQNITESRNTGNGFKDISMAVDPKGIKEEDLWKDLVENPNKWWDNRSSKRKPSYPDFKHKDTCQALWIGNKTPQWVLDKLPPAITSTEEVKK